MGAFPRSRRYNFDFASKARLNCSEAQMSSKPENRPRLKDTFAIRYSLLRGTAQIAARYVQAKRLRLGAELKRLDRVSRNFVAALA
jgi:hypothetical protein